MRTRSLLLSLGTVAGIAAAIAIVIAAAHPRAAAPAMQPIVAELPDRAAPASTAAPSATAHAAAADASVDVLVRTLASSSADEAARRAAHFALVDALVADPARALPALERFLAAARPSEAQRPVGAMIAAGTPEVQDALLRALDARRAEPAFAQLALPSLGFLARPTVRTEAALRALAEDGAASARKVAALSLGVMASRLAAAEPARAGAIVDAYAARLATARTAEERFAALDVLGNAATPAAAAAIATRLADPDAAIRGRAVEALRLVATADAEAALRRALADADDRVRARAAWSLSYRTPAPETLRAMLARLPYESSERVVSALLDAVWARRRVDPAAIDAAVRGLAGAHASDKVRARAQALLDGAA